MGVTPLRRIAVQFVVPLIVCCPFSHARDALAADRLTTMAPVEERDDGLATTGRGMEQRPLGVQRGNVEELTGLLQRAKLTELRTTYNGSYGASMLFYPSSATYYIALFQQKHLWRVVRTADRVAADRLYRTFVDETSKLAQAEISAVELSAGTALLETAIRQAEDRRESLRADLAIANAQTLTVDERQRAQTDEVQRLSAQTAAARARLNALERSVRQLEMQTVDGMPASVTPDRRR